MKESDLTLTLIYFAAQSNQIADKLTYNSKTLYIMVMLLKGNMINSSCIGKPTTYIGETKGVDQLCFINIMIPLLAKSEFLKLFCLAVKPGLCRTCSETQIVDFHMQKNICETYPSGGEVIPI